MSDSKGLTLMPLAEVRQMAEVVAKSGLFAEVKSADAAMALMLLCQAEGLHPVQALRRYHIINGRPAMKADAMLAEFQSRGGRVEWARHDDEVCAGVFSSPGTKGDTRVEWTLADAQRAGVTGNPTWKKYPRQMLRARVISEAVRMCMPEVVVGIYTPEEVADFEPARPEYTPPAKVAAATEEVERKIAALRAVESAPPKGDGRAMSAATATETQVNGVAETASNAGMAGITAVKAVFPGAKQDRSLNINALACGPAPEGLGWKKPHAKNWLQKMWGVDSTSALTEKQQADAEMLLQTRINSEDAYKVALTTLIAEGHVRAEAAE